MIPKILRLISRNSPLAMCQTNLVRQLLLQRYPQCVIEITGYTTRGDLHQDIQLSSIGGKGLFTQELETALRDDVADIAVHSCKDLSVNLAHTFTIGAFLAREDIRDTFISNTYATLDKLPPGSIIGTAAIRRSTLLGQYYPQHVIKLLRGNVNTRLHKLDNGEYDAIILAAAGLHRLGLSNRITQYLPANVFIPAIGQGALALQILSDNKPLMELLQPLNDYATSIAVRTEREVGRLLGANCGVPLAVNADVKDNMVHLRAYIANINLTCKFENMAPIDDYLSLAQTCASALLAQGADLILNKCQ